MMNPWIVLLALLMAGGAVSVLFQRSLRNAVLTFGIVSLVSAVMFALMKAYDVALTEASIGALLTTALFFWTLRRLEEDGYEEGDRHEKP
jgi:energy-converting hydrogenase B subunit D